LAVWTLLIPQLVLNNFFLAIDDPAVFALDRPECEPTAELAYDFFADCAHLVIDQVNQLILKALKQFVISSPTGTYTLTQRQEEGLLILIELEGLQCPRLFHFIY
jgi:hypothetical protein